MGSDPISPKEHFRHGLLGSRPSGPFIFGGSWRGNGLLISIPVAATLGVYCAGLGSPGSGDSNFLSAFSVTNAPKGALQSGGPGPRPRPRGMTYMEGTDRDDFRVNPTGDETLLAKGPPTIFFTATRDGAMSGALYSYRKLITLGIDSQVMVFDGLYHGFMTNPDFPEAQEGYRTAGAFYDKHLGR
jgi:hypothetical protein